jgi:hypothetical protein
MPDKKKSTTKKESLANRLILIGWTLLGLTIVIAIIAWNISYSSIIQGAAYSWPLLILLFSSMIIFSIGLVINKNKFYILTILSAILSVSLMFILAHSEVGIQIEINNANYCEIKEDCVKLEGKCPLGCSILVNKKEANKIKSLIDSYKETCIYDCMPLGGIKCENSKCLEFYP